MNGIILVDKPQDWTSHDVVAKLRGILHERRIGHSGTLDPLATGLLAVFVGRATRAVEFAEADSKEYIAGLRLGIATDTQDISGSIISRCDAIPSRETVICAVNSFVGEIDQLPPMYSAIKVGGKKLYELARRGESVERKSRKISINSIDVIGEDGGDLMLKVSCSKGTYIRTLCHDIGEKLGCGACMSSLRRTAAGVFLIENAHSIEEIQAAAASGDMQKILLPLDTLFAQFSELIVDENRTKRLKTGNIINHNAPNGKYRVYSESGEFLLLGEIIDGKLKTIKNFFEVN